MLDSQNTSPPEQLLPNFAVIVATIDIALPANEAWSKIGNYGDAGKYLNVESQQVSGDGGIGSVRIIGGAIVEVMVGKGPCSYTYAQTKGPMAQFTYHGNVVLAVAGERSSTLTYTINYDQTTMDDASRKAAVERIRPRFQGMIEAMKKAAETTIS